MTASRPVAPVSGYDTSDDDHDSPPSSQIGVSVTVLYDRTGDVRPVGLDDE